jgi:hypothetical protein
MKAWMSLKYPLVKLKRGVGNTEQADMTLYSNVRRSDLLSKFSGAFPMLIAFGRDEDLIEYDFLGLNIVCIMIIVYQDSYPTLKALVRIILYCSILLHITYYSSH